MLQPGSKKVRPWVRFFARTTDYWVGGFVIGTLLGILSPSVSNHTILLSMLAIFVWIFVEASMLSVWGTTPGKWLLRTTLRDSGGKKLTFSQALNRGFLVWWKGLGITLPFVSLLALIISKYRLHKNDVASWDFKAGYVVSHKTIGYPRAILMGLLLIGFSILTTELGTFNEMNKEIAEIAEYLDRNPILTEPINEGPYKGKHKVLIGGNLIRATLFHPIRYTAATIFLPHVAGAIRAGSTFVGEMGRFKKDDIY